MTFRHSLLESPSAHLWPFCLGLVLETARLLEPRKHRRPQGCSRRTPSRTQAWAGTILWHRKHDKTITRSSPCEASTGKEAEGRLKSITIRIDDSRVAEASVNAQDHRRGRNVEGTPNCTIRILRWVLRRQSPTGNDEGAAQDAPTPNGAAFPRRRPS